MIGSSRALKVWACPAPIDLRKGFDGLAFIVQWQLGKDALSGDCFLFTNRGRTSAKVLVYDGTGLGMYCKRLERGRFACLWKGPPGEPVALVNGAPRQQNSGEFSPTARSHGERSKPFSLA